MKAVLTSLSLMSMLLILSACSGKQPPANSNSGAPSADKESTRQSSSSGAAAAGKPIEFTCMGIAPDKEHIAYRIKINTDKPIEQVDVEVKYLDDHGNVSTETVIWQNIVDSTRNPIEQGKTYDVQDFMYPGTTKIECVAKRVAFGDGSAWNAS